jgi:hypothetical protein
MSRLHLQKELCVTRGMHAQVRRHVRAVEGLLGRDRRPVAERRPCRQALWPLHLHRLAGRRPGGHAPYLCAAPLASCTPCKPLAGCVHSCAPSIVRFPPAYCTPCKPLAACCFSPARSLCCALHCQLAWPASQVHACVAATLAKWLLLHAQRCPILCTMPWSSSRPATPMARPYSPTGEPDTDSNPHAPHPQGAHHVNAPF